jgi:hypothetical protein
LKDSQKPEMILVLITQLPVFPGPLQNLKK